jgi:hypothetical protein
MILNRKICFVLLMLEQLVIFTRKDKDLFTENDVFFLRNHWQDNFHNLFHVKLRSSLPQVGCVRGVNIFPNHNQFLTCESLTKPVYSGFLVTLN